MSIRLDTLQEQKTQTREDRGGMSASIYFSLTPRAGMVGLWQLQGLIELMVRRDLQERFRRSFMSTYCSVINPLRCMLQYTFLLSIVLMVQPGTGNFAMYLLAGLRPWRSLSESCLRARTAITALSAGFQPYYKGQDNVLLSGLIVRLALASAISVDPQILLVEEPLAVSNARFQQISVRKTDEMHTVSKKIIFVSHGKPSVEHFCDRAALLNGGQIITAGKSQGAKPQFKQMQEELAVVPNVITEAVS